MCEDNKGLFIVQISSVFLNRKKECFLIVCNSLTSKKGIILLTKSFLLLTTKRPPPFSSVNTLPHPKNLTNSFKNLISDFS
jgi:hypothetical protein